MIRYRKNLRITERQDNLQIETDMGQTWRCMEINSTSPMTNWTKMSGHTELQQWQKDMCKVILDAFVAQLPEGGANSYQLYHVYKKGQGYQSTSDVMLMRIPSKSVWFVCTTEHTWLIQEKYNNFTINCDDAIGSVLDSTVRQQLYDWSDQQRKIRKSKIKYTDLDYQAKGLTG